MTKPPAPRSFPARVALAAVLGYAGFSVAVGLYVGIRNTVPARKPPLAEPRELAPGAERFEVRTEDGLRIEGLLAPPPAGGPVLVMQHGKRSNRDDWLPWARVFARAGYGIACFDWRSHGTSDGRIISHGLREPLDLVAVLGRLAEDPRTRDRPIGIVAVSLGASCTAMTAPRLPASVKALVLDSPYGDLARMAADRLSKYGLLARGAGLVMDLYTWAWVGEVPGVVVPERTLAAFAPRPILVMHGDADEVIPVSEGRSLFQAYPGPKEYWESSGDLHCRARTNRTREWMGKVAGFLATHLPGAPTSKAVLALTGPRLPVAGF